MNRKNQKNRPVLWFLTLCTVLLLSITAAFAASTSISGETTAEPGDTVTLTVSYSGNDTVAVGLIYAYNSVIDSVTASNSSPWGTCKQDASKGQIGVGDYDGYDSGSWNYILNGTTTVVTFTVHISDDAQPGDVAKFKLKTAYYATTSNTLDEVTNQDLPTASLSSISITVAGGETPTGEVTPTVTPTPTKAAATEETATPTVTPVPTKATEKKTTVTPTPTKASEAKATLTPTPASTDSSDDDFIDRTPIVPSEVVDTIDDTNYDTVNDSYVVAATRDDAGKTILYEVGKKADGTAVYRKSITTEAGVTTVEELTEEQFSQEIMNINNYLADDDDPETYADDAQTATADNSSSANEKLPDEEKDVTEEKKTDEAAETSEASSAPVFWIAGIVIALMIIVFVLVIVRFKEGKHRYKED